MNMPLHPLALKSIAHCWKAKLPLAVSHWVSQHRRLSEESSPISGPWNHDETPFLVEIMDSLSEHVVGYKVVFRKSSQVGGTEVASNWLGYILHHAKGPVAVVMPTESSLMDWISQKFDPMTRATKAVGEMLSTRVNYGENSQSRKKFVGGTLYFKTAGSVAELKSTSLRYIVGDEIDEWTADKDQGDKIKLLEVRMRAYLKSGGKLFLVSSPTVKGASNIDAEYEGGDQRLYHVPCPDCGHCQPLVFKNLKWMRHPDNGVVMSVHYACEDCGVMIDESQKREMLKRGFWVPQRLDAAYRSYHINALYSSERLGLSWRDIANQWLEAQGDDDKLKVFLNTVLGECWQPRGEVKANALKERAEPYELRTVPEGCLGITCGVDTQDDRLEVQVLGHGAGGKTWVLDYHVLPGNPADDLVWNSLTQYINGIQFANRFGKVLRSEATMIDTGGHHTHAVYAYVRRREIVRPMAGKGASTTGKMILGRPTEQDINHRGKLVKKGVKLYSIGVDTAKHLLYNRLHDDADKPAEKRKIHFSCQLDDSYYNGLTAEIYDPTKNKWVCRKGKRNEPLDTWVYAVAASHHPELYWHKFKVSDWERRAATLEPADLDPVVVDEPPEPIPTDKMDAPLDREPRKNKRRGGSGGFINSW